MTVRLKRLQSVVGITCTEQMISSTGHSEWEELGPRTPALRLIILQGDLVRTVLANIKNTIILFACPPKILHKHCFYFLLGLTMIPRETGNNAYAKFWVDKQRVLWYFLYWLIGLTTSVQMVIK